MNKIKVHIIGTHGVPAKYGGFETLADHLCQNLINIYDITVYCNSKKYPIKEKKYFGAELKYLNIDANGFSGIFYDFYSFIYALFKADVILYLSPVGSGFMTILKKIFPTKVIVNHGGLNEWEREKYSWVQKKWAKFNHSIASKYSDINIVDNELYKNSLHDIFKAKSIVIRYGGDHVIKKSINNTSLIAKYPFVNEKYAISVSRAQLDNNIHTILEAFENFDDYKIVIISNWSISSYGKDLFIKYNNHPNMILLNAIYEVEELDFLRTNSYFYIHSHSRCGTAPSLVEAMNLGKAIISFDVPTNRETTQNKAIFFNNSTALLLILKSLCINDINFNGNLMKNLAQRFYTWNIIANQYRKVIDSISK